MFNYNMQTSFAPFKNGFFIPTEEWDIECSFKQLESDQMFCFGVNSNGECLAVQITKECICDSTSSLYLKIDKYTYSLPTKINYLKSETKRTFGNNRFYIKCLIPFRKWKIFFNGMLREICPSTGHDRIIHGRFSFIWVASSGIFDFASDYSLSSLSDILSETKWDSMLPPIERILSILNEYHQPGMLHGIVQIDDKSEQEIYLWGSRRHSFGIKDGKIENHFIDLFGNAENGFFFHFKIMSVQNFVKRNIIGFIMKPNGFLKAVRILYTKRIHRHKKTVLCFKIKAGDCYYSVSAFFYGYGGFFEKRLGDHSTISIIDILVNGFWGSGIAIERICSKSDIHNKNCEFLKFLNEKSEVEKVSNGPLVVTFDDPLCLNKSLSGNLVSSMAKVMHMKEVIYGFDMLDGIVITTEGYKEFSTSIYQGINLLKENLWKYDTDELIPLCNRIVQEVSNSYFPSEIYDILCQKFTSILVDSENPKFCIYPSVAGSEPEAQLLEAYIDSFSDVIGLGEIIRSVKKCWASQFSFDAVVCKRSSGLCLNKPIAIVIQKAISFNTSGFIMTCDPLSGNPSIMKIREETEEISELVQIIYLRRDMKNCFKVLDINFIFKKANTKIDENYTISKRAELVSCKSWLSTDQVLSLGQIAHKIENIFQHPLCIQWGIKENNFLILQVRPIIIFNAETNFEILHYWDSYFRTEDEWFSTLSIGEPFMGAISPLGIDVLNFCLEIFIAEVKYFNSEFIGVPYFPKFLNCSYNHLLYCLADGVLYLQNMSQNLFLRSLSFILNVKVSEDQTLQHLIYNRHGKFSLSFKMMFHSVIELLLSGKRVKSLDEIARCYNFSIEDIDSPTDMLKLIALHYKDLSKPFIFYMNSIYSVTIWSMILIYILASMRKDKNQTSIIYKDFNFLMSASSASELGDIPLDMLTLSKRIAQNINPDKFMKMSLEDAKIWLEDAEIDRKIHFSDFIRKHGHRSFKEIDIFDKCWNMDPFPVIRVLQNIVPFISEDISKHQNPFDSIFCQLSVMPNCFQRLLLKYVVHKCMKSMQDAKRAKSSFLTIISYWKTAFYHLANNAVKKFHLPFDEALFFLSLEDIRQLLLAESPHLVIRALKCWEMHSIADKYIFPVVAVGFPVPLSENYYADKRLSVGSELKGCPISRGVAIGSAVVATKLDEITSLENGSILITASPCISWTLYFPVLGGFAADLGGLISEGAVIAREIGIPCVINLVQASHVLKTGDRVMLDGNVGILKRLPSE